MDRRAKALLVVPAVVMILVCGLAVRPTHGAVDVLDGLIGHWAHNEGAGATETADSSGNNHTGTVGSATVNQAGKFGRAIAFPGDSAISIEDAADLDLVATSFTIAMWINKTGEPVNASGAILHKEDGGFTSPWGGYVLFYDKATQRLKFRIRNSSNSSATHGTSASINTNNVWNHVAVTLTYSATGNDTIEMFVNSASSGGTLSTPIGVSNTDSKLGIGNSVFGGADFGWNGLVDDVGIWDRVLNGDEIAHLGSGDGNLIPDPGTLGVMAVGLIAVALRRRRREKMQALD